MRNQKTKDCSDPFLEALRVAARYIGTKARFEREVRDKLASFSPEIVDRVVESLAKDGFLSNQRTVQEAVQGLSGKRAMSNDLVRAKLLARGAEPAEIETALASRSENDAAIDLLQHKFRSTRPELARAWRYLCSKGFDPDLAQEAVDRFFQPEADDQ